MKNKRQELEETKKFVREKFYQFIEEEQKRLGLAYLFAHTSAIKSKWKEVVLNLIKTSD